MAKQKVHEEYENFVTVTVRVSPELSEDFKAYAYSQDRTQAHLIRDFMRKCVKEHKERLELYGEGNGLFLS